MSIFYLRRAMRRSGGVFGKAGTQVSVEFVVVNGAGQATSRVATATFPR